MNTFGVTDADNVHVHFSKVGELLARSELPMRITITIVRQFGVTDLHGVIVLLS